MLNDHCKYGYDHIKGAFGALTLFNAVYKKYYLASIDTARCLKIVLAYARRKFQVILEQLFAYFIVLS